MKTTTSLTLLVILIFNSCARRNSGDYNELITEARELYEAGKYEEAGENYSKAFATTEGSDTLSHQYEAAKAWTLANEKDLAFAQLSGITDEGKYADLGQISSDNDFNSLRTDTRWMTLLNKVNENKKDAEAELADVAALLETVRYDDQKYRQELGEIQEKYGQDSEEILAHWELIHEQDSINLIKVEKILEDYGWLGWDQIGRRANGALFLVIQHADLETQEKYLPVIREAVKKGNAAPGDLALLEDRVALRQGEKQIYGSQISTDMETGEYYLSPLQDPDNVDQRRAEVGLGPIQDYISNWGLTWDAEAHKKWLQEMKAID